MSILVKGNGITVIGPRKTPPSPLFKMTIDTTQAGSASDTFVLPLMTPNPDIYSTNFVVDWGDGSTDTITSRTDPALTHVYSSSGTYQISLDGEWDGIQFNNGGDKLKLSSIDNWGTNQWKAMTGSFRGCTNMVANYSDSPDTSLVNYMGNAFLNCTNFNGQVNFDTSACTFFGSMFAGCTNFNQEVIFNAPLLGTTYSMFNGCVNFNSIVNLTTTSSLLTTERMFQGCSSFNSSVTISDTSGVTNMGVMFYVCTSFNQPITFDTSTVTTMSNMFYNCDAFDQTINFDGSALLSTYKMFQGCHAL